MCGWSMALEGALCWLRSSREDSGVTRTHPREGRVSVQGRRERLAFQLCLELSCPWPDTQLGAVEWTLCCFSLDIENNLEQGISRDSSGTEQPCS